MSAHRAYSKIRLNFISSLVSKFFSLMEKSFQSILVLKLGPTEKQEAVSNISINDQALHLSFAVVLLVFNK